MKTVSAPTRALLALSGVKGVGPATLRKISAHPHFWELGVAELSATVPQFARALGGQSAEVTWQAAKAWSEGQIEMAEKHQTRILSPLDDEYPKLLAQTQDDPFLLFVKGSLAAAPERSVAIIGTREPTAHGVLVAERITQFFVEQSWSVVSGLALGCDSIAHRAAVNAGGHTVAVLAHGLQMIAPSRHKQLAEDILDSGGALVSEYPFGHGVQAAQFVKRDRTQAGMAQGVVMVQSDVKGGSLHASRAALNYNRWLAVPYPTGRDRDNNEPKVQANLLIADGRDTERADLLRCPLSALKLVRVVRSRLDYLRLVSPDMADAAILEDAGVGSTSLFEDSAQDASPAMTERFAVEEGMPTDSGPRGVAKEAPAPEEAAKADEATAAPVKDNQRDHEHRVETEPAVVPGAPVEPSYHVVVGLDDWKQLRLVRVHSDLVHRDLKGRNVVDTKAFVALSRLSHLQERLDELRRRQTSKRAAAELPGGTTSFQIEEVVIHMTRVADELVQLHHGSTEALHETFVYRAGAASGQPELPLAGGRAPDNVPLITLLHRLVDALPQSAASWHEEGVANGAIDVSLRDLVHSFNGLVTTVLPEVASAVPESKERAKRV